MINWYSMIVNLQNNSIAHFREYRVIQREIGNFVIPK